MLQAPVVMHAVREALTNQHVMPGHRFSLYFPYWVVDEGKSNKWEKAPDRRDGEGAKLTALRIPVQDSKQSDVGDLITALRTRQAALAQQAGAETIEAISQSPFVTGMGEEHAVENGFAFLNPYGLPYLAGSGVKGVIRRAAEDLAEMGESGWTFARVVWLFGYEDYDTAAWKQRLEAEIQTDDEARALLQRLNKEAASLVHLSEADKHLAGALSFWDVIIDGKLDVDILTPHYGKYYEGKEPPHDAGQPQPNPFLVVAPGAHFTFHVTCTEHRLPDTIKAEWRTLLHAAFDHAFTWGGFGAKTAMGYGVLATPEMLQEMKEQAAANKVPEIGDKVEIIQHNQEKFIGRKGEIIKILDNPVIGEKVAQLRPIDDGGKLKGIFPLSGLKCLTEE